MKTTGEINGIAAEHAVAVEMSKVSAHQNRRRAPLMGIRHRNLTHPYHAKRLFVPVNEFAFAAFAVRPRLMGLPQARAPRKGGGAELR